MFQNFSLQRLRTHLILWPLAALLSLSACKPAKETPPVPEATMMKVLTDMHLAEVYSQGIGDSVRNRFEKNYDSLSAFYISILKHHKISFETFNETIAWYKERPAMMDSLYARVLSNLVEIRTRAGIKDSEEKPGMQSPAAGGNRDTVVPGGQTTPASVPIRMDTSALKGDKALEIDKATPKKINAEP